MSFLGPVQAEGAYKQFSPLIIPLCLLWQKNYTTLQQNKRDSPATTMKTTNKPNLRIRLNAKRFLNLG